MRVRQHRDSQHRAGQNKCRSPLRLEYLEDRVLLDATVIEDFSAGTLDAYRSIYKFYPSGSGS